MLALGQPDPNTDSVLYNAMIMPYAKFTFKAATWYQAESNTDTFGGPDAYPCLFTGMIDVWRQLFDNPTMPFLFVQLAPWNNTAEGGPQFALSEMRVAQAYASQIIKFCGFASAIDLGDIDSPDNNIHPRDKQDVGSRLALVGEQLIYNMDTLSQGPVLEFAREKDGADSPTVRVLFEAETVGSGLMLVNQPAVNCPPDLLDASKECGIPMIQLTDGNWYNATVVIDEPTAGYVDFVMASDSVVYRKGAAHASHPRGVTDPFAMRPTAVSYAYADFPICNIYNSANLPALPFLYVFTN